MTDPTRRNSMGELPMQSGSEPFSEADARTAIYRNTLARLPIASEPPGALVVPALDLLPLDSQADGTP
jgi:hypothetical protein